MDNLTHTLVGALIGQAGLKRKTGLAMPALLIGANIPDVDVGCFLWLDGLEHLAFRRGITHGPPAMVLLPLALAGALYWFDRWQERRGTRPEERLPVRFGWLFVLSFIACLSHPTLDWLNVYGVRLLEPFSSQWFYGDTLFIIDVWLWAGLGLATWLSLRREKRAGDWRWPARAALMAGLAYIGANWLISRYAADMAILHEPYPQRVIANPVPIAFWRRDIVALDMQGRWMSTGWSGADAGYGYRRPAGGSQCSMDGLSRLKGLRSNLGAFLFWSRAPFALSGPDGLAIINDARFYDPRTAGRFSVALPEVRCEPVAQR